MRLAELGFHDEMVRRAFEQRMPIVEEFEPAADVALLCRCLPMLARDEVVGGVLLVRDVTDLRKRDRLLISKDATIREIHHRVKNNLQTISSLLRLQARRLQNPEAKAAVSESVRRIRTIALVHESLSREPGDDVTFIEIVRPLLRLAEESLQSPDRPVQFSLVGRRRPDPGAGGHAAVGRADRAAAERRRPRLPGGQWRRQGRGRRWTTTWSACSIEVVDDGRGLEAGFDLDAATGLGLSIVRTLVTTELNGQISMRPASRGRPARRRSTSASTAATTAPWSASSSRSPRRADRRPRCDDSHGRVTRPAGVALQTGRMRAGVAVVLLVIGAVVVTRLSGLVLRRVVRRFADRRGGDVQAKWWRAGASRIGAETTESREQRRRQRVDAAARMINHLVSVAIWIGVVIAVFHLFEIDAAFFLSGAGFIGAALAIGGQHKVNDYLTGLSVLVEDRYGVGDELVVEVAGREPIHAVVDHVGLVTTRLRDQHSTLHVPNAQLLVVRNLSQEAAAATVRLRVPDASPDPEASAAAAVRNLAGTEHLTEVVFVGDVAAHRAHDGEVDVAVRTSRPLDARSRSVLVERAEEALRAGR